MQAWTHRLIIACGSALLALFSAPSPGMYVLPEIEQVPLERLITNLQRTIDQNPRDVQSVLNLARAHAMAYSRKTEVAEVASFGTTLRPEDAREWWPGYPSYKPVFFDNVTQTSDPAQLKLAQEHLSQAVAGYRRAAELDPSNLVIRLGLAWLIEQSGDQRDAVSRYRAIAADAWKAERRLRTGSLDQYFVTSETAGYLIPLLDPIKDKQEIARLRAQRTQLQKLPRPVTPIAIPLAPNLELQDLEDRNASVSFDADGSGIRKQWSWITPQAAWLVHLAQPDEQITSALQWFGGVTFWLFWDNGYQALGALDDNGDGQLTTSELEGLALWQDQNGNGVSELGEVSSLAAHGITALSYRYQIDAAHPDRIAFVPEGVTYRDGSTRPTYDLVLHPAKARLRL